MSRLDLKSSLKMVQNSIETYLLFDLLRLLVAYTVLRGFGEEFIFALMILSIITVQVLFYWCSQSLTLTLGEIFANFTSVEKYEDGSKREPAEKGLSVCVLCKVGANSFVVSEQKKEAPPPRTINSQWRTHGPPWRDGASSRRGTRFRATRITSTSLYWSYFTLVMCFSKG